MIIVSLFTCLASNATTVIASLFVALVTVVLVKYMSGPKAGKNPFGKDTTRPPKPLVTDQSARDNVIKQGFAVKKVPDNLDVIIIGSGIGGLAAASLLARSGKKVLVLEQHDQAGGCCHSFIDKGYEFDVGIHYIGEMTYNSMLKVYVDHLTDGQLQWATMDDPIDTIIIGQGDDARQYPRFSGKDKFRQGLIDKFPDEVEAIDKYMKYIMSSELTELGQVLTKLLPMWLNKFLSSTGLVNLLTNYYKNSQRSVKEVVEELTNNKDLQAVMSYCYGDYGTMPSEASFALQCGLMFHFLKGGSYPIGGASEIAFHIIPSIEKAGGKVLVRAPVSQILLDGEGGAYGVRVHKSSGDVDIHAPIIISDAGLFNTFQSLLPPQILDKSVYKPLMDNGKIRHGMGCMSLFVGLKGSKKELDIEGRNWWVFNDNDLDKQCREFLSQSGDEIGKQDIPMTFISFPSAKDPTWEERYPGKSTCVVITLANYEWFQEWEDERVMKRGEVYEKRKNALADALWQQTLKLFPDLKDKVEYFDIGSPVSNKHYIGSPKGEIYGLDHTVGRFDSDTISALRSETLVPNLYLTGQDVYCCGFAGALTGALFCAGTVLHRNLFVDVTMLQFKLSRKNKGK